MQTSSVANVDVLIVGGGMAGLMAALAVCEKGRSATVVSLGPVARSGNTVVAGGVISGVSGGTENTVKAFLTDLESSGQGIADPALFSCLADESGEMLLRLERLGVEFLRQDDGFVRLPAPGHTVPRTVSTNWKGFALASRGMTFLKPLEQRAAEAGVHMISGLRVLRLIKEDGRVIGVEAYERVSGKRHLLHAGSVILACGGYGGLYSQSGCVADIYGDALSMALEAGCTLRDMEFVQFYPVMMLKPLRIPIPGAILKAGAVLRNSSGERFMHLYDSEGDEAKRDIMARAVFLEIQAGRGIDKQIYVDCSKVPQDKRDSLFGSYADKLRKFGLDLAKDWLLGLPTAHYSLGGICIDASGRTGVSGLYAAGEAAGGVHGVNRLAGCALMEAAVFGRRAGLAAADETVGCKPRRVPDSNGNVAATPILVTEDMHSLKSLMWEHASLVRSAQGLESALREVHRLKAKWLEQAESAKANGFSGSLQVAEAVIRSAALRTESRGAHYRSDYPETDSHWCKPVYCRLNGKELDVF